MTYKYLSRGHPSCFTADKEKIVKSFFMGLIPYLCSYGKKK